jgi:hypothetical protein
MSGISGNYGNMEIGCHRALRHSSGTVKVKLPSQHGERHELPFAQGNEKAELAQQTGESIAALCVSGENKLIAILELLRKYRRHRQSIHLKRTFCRAELSTWSEAWWFSMAMPFPFHDWSFREDISTSSSDVNSSIGESLNRGVILSKGRTVADAEETDNASPSRIVMAAASETPSMWNSMAVQSLRPDSNSSMACSA